MICDRCVRQSSCIARQMGERSPQVIDLLRKMKTCSMRQQTKHNRLTHNHAQRSSTPFIKIKSFFNRIVESSQTGDRNPE
ncbi:MAG: hypothetical protein AAFR31_12685 [Cyanobacteria bacterium J06627_8]